MGTMLAEVNLIVDEVFKVYTGLDPDNFWDVLNGTQTRSYTTLHPMLKVILDEVEESFPMYSIQDTANVADSTKKQLYAQILQRLTEHKTKLDALVVALDAIYDALP